MNYPTTEQVATKLEKYARTIAPAVALVLTAVVHTYWLGQRAIAERLGVSRTTVRRRLAAAM